MITFVGQIVQQETGCAEGGGQDYARLESPQGVIEYHPPNGTTGQGKTLNFKGSLTVGVELSSIGVGGGWEATVSNLTIQTVHTGATRDVVIALAVGGYVIAIHIQTGTVPAGWAVGVRLNVGIKNT